jgi:tetratricopeptide (TPR) repeat protein
MESLRDALGIRQKLATLNPTINPIQRDLSQSHYLIGWVLSQTGKSEEALEEYGKALGIRQKLADANPTVTQYQQDLANTHNNVGWLLAQMGKPEEAMEAYRDALAIFQKLADAHRDVPRFQSELVMVHINVGRLLASQKRFPEAFATLDESLARSQKLAKADPKTLLHAQNLVWSHAFRGWTRVRVGQPAEAAADLRRAVELWAELPQLDTEAKFERSRVLALLAGLGGDAKSGVTAAEAKAFADQAVAALRDAIKAGWAQAPADLKEPDFDALRGRADFRKLVAEVEARAEKSPVAAPLPQEKE